ncbi:MAG: aspartyl protease family protein [Treponema sp.]|jgi:clan AA aspartic protease|nr:aspartyl protease family protein [Treponema sp.]
MGNFSQKITLKNQADLAMFRHGFIKEAEVREVTIEALVDTGASILFITEEVRQKLGLTVEQKSYATIANGMRQPCQRTEPVAIYWKNRSTVCPAMVIPGADTNLLGAIPLEGMDLKVNPVAMCLEGVNGEYPLYLAL